MTILRSMAKHPPDTRPRATALKNRNITNTRMWTPSVNRRARTPRGQRDAMRQSRRAKVQKRTILL
jgi:hypothetical protein